MDNLDPSSKQSSCEVVILAGGFGKRIAKVVPDKPKPLAEVNGKPFLSYLLEQISQTSLTKVTLCIGYRGKQIQDFFGPTFQNLTLSYSFENKPLGTAGALRSALSFVSGETILVMNGDSYCELDLDSLLRFHQQRTQATTIALAQVPDISNFGSLDLSTDGTISAFKEKTIGHHAGMINAGIYVMSRSLIEDIPENKQISLEREIFPNWVNKGINAYLDTKRFIDIGTPESYARAKDFFSLRE